MRRRGGRSPVTRPMRRAAVAAAALVSATALSGCITPFACTAVGWIDTLTVQLDGDPAAVAQVQLCTDDGCAPSAPMDLTGPLGMISMTGHDGDTWTFSTGMSDLSLVTVRALAADGSVISDTEVEPEWVRVGGSERCGGPHEGTATVTI